MVQVIFEKGHFLPLYDILLTKCGIDELSILDQNNINNKTIISCSINYDENKYSACVLPSAAATRLFAQILQNKSPISTITDMKT